jgi:ABC-2 type transport system permease protein
MWLIIAKKEILLALRDKLFLSLAAIIWLLLIVAAAGGYARYKNGKLQQQTAGSLLQQEWEEQEANPHSAAHFGTWLFKPFNFLTLYDNGLNNFTGISYRVEAHKQHEINYSSVQDTDSQLRFGELSIALVFQLLVPLLIILLAHGAITRERAGNTLRILAVQGAKPSVLIRGKIAGNYAIILMLLLPALVLLATGALILGEPALLKRSLLFCIAYLAWFLLISIFTVLSSAWSRNSTSSLITCLGVWVFCSILLPRMSANWADQAAPLPSRHAFNRAVQQGYSKGMNNDGTAQERRKRYQETILKQYKVDSLNQLPVNFDGLSMQYGEDYNSQVYQQVAKITDSLIRRQQSFLETTALLNPFMAIQQVSMGLTGTDYFHHLSFHQQAREYRDEFIRALNLELAKNGGPHLTYDYKVGPDWFKKTKPFHWQMPSTSDAFGWHASAWTSIGIWLLAACLLIPVTAKKMDY